ncbi:MAG: hypothetical protein U9O65_00795 [Thermotogota bacterium]|nr:hypothetical protein [Thermotogota bacterium]
MKLVKEINFFRRDTLEVTGDPPGSESPPEEEIPPDEVSPPEEVLPSDEETVNYDEKDGGQ